MNSRTRQYLFAFIFLGVGIYQLYKQDYLEASLYFLAGVAFISNTLTLEPKLFSYKRVLIPITWTLIIMTAILFLYLMQFKYL